MNIIVITYTLKNVDTLHDDMSIKIWNCRDLKAALNAIQPQGGGEEEGDSEDRKRKREDEKEGEVINGKE